LIEVSDEEFESEFADLPLSEIARRSRLAALENQVRDDPLNTEAWITYSTHHLPPSKGDPLDGPFDQASAEVTLSILGQGAKVNPALHLPYLRVAQYVQTTGEVAARWQFVLAEHPISPDTFQTWIAYLGWCESDGFNNVDQVLEKYADVIETLRSRTLLDQPLESFMLYLVLRAAKLLNNTGMSARHRR
jgi:hypothetical protein